MTMSSRNINQCVAPFLDGDLSNSKSDQLMEITNPSNGQYLFSIPTGCDTDVDRAVASARCAFDSGRWSETPPSFRKKILHRLADLIVAEATELDALDAEEMGKPIREARANAAAAAGFMRFYAEAIDKVSGEVLVSDPYSVVTQRWVPRGVVAAVTPWNFPTSNAVRKLAPAIAAGNSVVLKPSELSSRSAIRLAHLAMQAGLPPGVLNVVPGQGDIVGRALGVHMDVDMLAFTGSTTVGKCMLQYAGQSNMKLVIVETGGKSPQIVFSDGIDLDEAADGIARSLLCNQGQVCSAGSRVLVQRSIELTLLEKIATRFKSIVIGDAMDPTTTFGPVVSANQCLRVMRYIENAETEGAQLVTGGRRTLQESGGYYIEPTIFKNVLPTARIAQEEIFGPVLAVIPFESEAEAIQIANGTEYGLMAYVWTADLSRGMRMARGVRSPVSINATTPKGEGIGCNAALEPARQSGVGAEGGLPGLAIYQRRQLVSFNYA